MIDNLISSDFTALAREHRRVPSLDAVMPREREKVVRPPLKLNRWIVRAIIAGSAVMAVRTQWFDNHPQSAPLIVISIISLLGLFDTGIVRDSFTRQLGAILGAIGLTATALTMFLVDHSQYSTMYIDSFGGRYVLGPEDHTDPLTVVGISILAIVGGYAVAGVLEPWIKQRALQPWSALAKIASTSVFVTWIGVCDFDLYARDAVSFRPYVRPLWEQLQRQIGQAEYNAFTRSDYHPLSVLQFDLLLAAGSIAVFVASIALAYRSKATLAAKWLAVAEHVVIAPLGVAFGMLNLVIYITHRQSHDDGGGYAALAMVGVLVAFTSMMLRRLRRSMIASR